MDIKLSEEQAAIVANATGPVHVCLPDGKVAGYVVSTNRQPRPQGEPTAEELAEIKRRMHSPGPWLTTEEVLAYLGERESRQ
jgi:hypothetical protein